MIPRRAVLSFAVVAACTDPAGPPAPTPLVTETPALRAMALGATPLSVDDRGRPRLMKIRPGAIILMDDEGWFEGGRCPVREAITHVLDSGECEVIGATGERGDCWILRRNG